MAALHFTDASFQADVLESKEPVLVDFWAAWCGPCRAIAPLVEELSVEYAGKAKIGKVDVDSNPEISMTYGIRSIPALLVFKDGKVVEQIIGAVPKPMLVRALENHMGVSA